MFDTKVEPTTLRGYKIKIYPTEEQKKILDRQIELSRWVYNWAVELQLASLDRHEGYIPFVKMYDEFMKIYTNPEYGFLHDIPKHIALNAIRHVETACFNYCDKRCRKPKFKSDKYSKKSFETRNEPNAFYFKDTKVRISGLPFGDMIECKHHNIPMTDINHYYRCTITFDGKFYWLSVNTEKPLEDYPDVYDGSSNESIGIDLGFRTTVQLSNGKFYNLPKRKLRVLKRRHSKLKSKITKRTNARLKRDDQIPSKNELKLRDKEYTIRKRIRNISISFAHNVTTEIVNTYPKRIVMENLLIKNLKRMRHFAKDNPGILYDIRVMMEYKCKERGIEFVKARANFPSSKLCSCCGQKHNPGTSKTYCCSYCGLVIDRDLNAAINLSRYGL